MPNLVDATGLQTSSLAELIANFTATMQAIYGANIDLSSSSADGQMMNLFLQAVVDNLELQTQVYNSFDPDNAVGVVLDQRVAINGIQRQGGTFTVTNVTVVTTQSVNLYGLDQTAEPVFTVSDSAGTLWELQTTHLGVLGTHAFAFQAAVPGAVLTVPNTITVPVTIILGVASVNNPTTYTTLGVNEETDAQLRVRRQKSVSLSSQGYLAGLLAALENINGVTSAFVYENTSGSTNGDGVPGHSVWVIVAGSGAAADIANAIYTKRNAGCGMFGGSSYTITQVDGTPLVVLYDTVVTQDIFIAFTTSSLNGTTAPSIAAIRAGLVSSFVPGVNAEVNINELATLVQEIDPNTLVTAAGFSAAFTQILTLSGVAASGAFVWSYNGVASASIAWNDSIGTIQTKIRAITGLSLINVTGSIASQTLTFDFSAVPAGVVALGVVTTNTLQTGGSVAITFAYNEGYANTLTPSSKKNQFVVASPNIVILPMILSAAVSSVAHGGTVQLTGLGGYGSYTYSVQTNNSGGSVNATTGVYTAGSTPNVTDTLKVIDQQGNSATVAIAVT